MTGPGLSQAATGLATPGRAAPSERWWALERHHQLVAGAQTRAGRTALVAVFALAALAGGVSLPYVLAAAAFAYWPAWRGWILAGTAAVALGRSWHKWLNMLEPVAVQAALSLAGAQVLVWVCMSIYITFAWAALRRVRLQPDSMLARRPVLGQVCLAGLLALLVNLPGLSGSLRLALWILLCLLGTHLWVLAYGLQDQRSRSPGPLLLQAGLVHPFWRAGLGSLSPTPFGKGAAFLRKHQAVTGHELAVTQLKGLKLMVWALVLGLLSRLLHEGARHLGIPLIEEALPAFAAGQPFALHTNWASLVVSAAGAALSLAILGHKIIAVARLAGFRLPRNTWRPLEARTLAEFWNRYYYYFKELLVDFFFLPTFFKVFKRHPRLRVFFATFMAAGVGNALYHFLRDIHLVAQMGWQAASVGYASNLLYCALLATGIGISQARLSAGRRLAQGWAARLWSMLCVWGFFVLLQVFGHEDRHLALSERFAFFLALFWS